MDLPRHPLVTPTGSAIARDRQLWRDLLERLPAWA